MAEKQTKETAKKKTAAKDVENSQDKATDTSTDEAKSQPVQPQVAIHAQYVKDLSFESPGAPDIFINKSSQPNVDIGVNVEAQRLENNHFEVVLKIAATAKTEDRPIFIIELSYAGIASTNVSDEKILHPLIAIEAPRLLFPFARAVISNVTREGGFLPLNLNPIDFLALYQSRMRQAQASAAEAGAGAAKPQA